MSWLRNDSPATALSDPDPDQDPAESDAELVAQAKLGEARAFALLYRRYVDQVYDFVAHRVPSTEAAEDITQVTFMKAMKSLESCREPHLFAGWLFAIARNAIRDSYRTMRMVEVPLEAAPDLEDIREHPETVALHAEWSQELRKLRETCLDEKARDLLDLRMQGLNDREISVVLHRTHGAIRTAQYRLVQRLRECLGLNRHTGEVELAND